MPRFAIPFTVALISLSGAAVSKATRGETVEAIVYIRAKPRTVRV
jgi:hypothetical protein